MTLNLKASSCEFKLCWHGPWNMSMNAKHSYSIQTIIVVLVIIKSTKSS